MQTIAVYQEEQVKVYGITEKSDLALTILSFSPRDTSLWGQRISDFEKSVKRFELVTCHATGKNRIDLHLVFDRQHLLSLSNKISALIKNEQNTTFTIESSVDILFLFGPHFQDRFGIVDIAFNALLHGNIDIFVSGCAGTSMYFVTPKNQGRRGLKILKDTFVIPTTI